MCTEKIKEETEYVGSLLLGKIYTGKIPSVTMTITIREPYALVYSFRSNHIAIIGGYIEFHQYLYGIYDETF